MNPANGPRKWHIFAVAAIVFPLYWAAGCESPEGVVGPGVQVTNRPAPIGSEPGGNQSRGHHGGRTGANTHRADPNHANPWDDTAQRPHKRQDDNPNASQATPTRDLNTIVKHAPGPTPDARLSDTQAGLAGGTGGTGGTDHSRRDGKHGAGSGPAADPNPNDPNMGSVSLPTPDSSQTVPRSTVGSVKLNRATGILANTAGADSNGPARLPLNVGRSGAGPSTAQPGSLRLPLLLSGSKPAPAPAPNPIDSPDLAGLPALKLPPQSDRLTALQRIRASTLEDFILSIDGATPRLLTRAETLQALQAKRPASVVVLPLTAGDAQVLGRWIDSGRIIETPNSWMTTLEQSSVSRAHHHDRRQTELDRVRKAREKLRDGMYRFLLGKPTPTENKPLVSK
jgi:hypothetical protein